MGTTGIILVVGVVAIGAYLVISSTSQTSSDCAGDWTDYFNPVCWVSATANAATNELNTVLIIVAFVVVVVVALLAFGPQTQHITRAASGALL